MLNSIGKYINYLNFKYVQADKFTFLILVKSYSGRQYYQYNEDDLFI